MWVKPVIRLAPWPALLCVLSLALHSSARSVQGKENRTREACAACHAKIVATYSQTAMYLASGSASQNPITGTFEHQQSGVSYRVLQENGKLWLEYRRSANPTLQGKKQLLYYIGSGKLKGRTYLFEIGGFLFESPINWYAQKQLWDMAPNYAETREAPLNLPAFPECLNCHTSGMHPPAVGTANEYPEPPFVHGGITCERCHGSASQHVARGVPMLKLASLSASRRDSICMQCHLEGDMTIERPHKHAYEFSPGDDLSDYVRYFLRTNRQGTRAVSQFEALAQSGCKRASGDKMTCTSCHDPHYSPDAASKVNYYRTKCLGCHSAAFGEKHHPENRDCMNCHMLALSTRDISHTEATDHRILKRPEAVIPNRNSETAKLEPFPVTAATQNDIRDLALAYETLVERGDQTATAEAEKLLIAAGKQGANDASVLTALGYLAQQQGKEELAREYYENALRLDSYNEEAATNLGVTEAKEGHLQRAVGLWQNVFRHAPWRSSVGIDIALGYCAAGRYDDAAEYVKRVLEFNPDFTIGRSLRNQLSENPPSCSLKP